MRCDHIPCALYTVEEPNGGSHHDRCNSAHRFFPTAVSSGFHKMANRPSMVQSTHTSGEAFRMLAGIEVKAKTNRDGYVQLLMTIRAITRA